MKISIMKREKNATYVKKSFVMIKIKKMKFKLYKKVRDHCHYTGKFRGSVIAFVISIIKYPKKFL